MKRLTLLFIFSLLILPLVVAQPPFQSGEENANGIQVFEPRFEFVKAKQNFNLHVHISNISTGLEIPNSVSNCSLHLYNSSGDHILQSYLSKDANGLDHKLSILGGNFTEGLGFYRIYCNATNIGGSVSGTYEVNSVGEELTESHALVYVGLLALLCLLFIVIIFGISALPSENDRGPEGTIISINKLKYLRMPLWYIEYFLLITILYLAANIGFAYFVSAKLFANTFFMFYKILFALAPVITIVWFISFFIMIWNDKEFKNMLDRGIYRERV